MPEQYPRARTLTRILTRRWDFVLVFVPIGYETHGYPHPWAELPSLPLGELASCCCRGTVSDYTECFLELLPRTGPLSSDQQIQLFTMGLQEPLSIVVQL